MWVLLAFASAFLLGLYDVFKKKALDGNAVIPVLFANTVVALIIYIPFLLLSSYGPVTEGSLIYVPAEGTQAHMKVLVKSFLVITSWLFGYFGIKHLPITIVGPINATRPVVVLIGAMALYGERLNPLQWGGVLLAFTSIFLLSRTGRKEGIDFAKNKWVAFVAVSALFAAMSGLYDKYLMGIYTPIFVQAWFNIYQFFIMAAVLMLLWWPRRKNSTPFRWNNSIVMIPLVLAFADFAYFTSLGMEESMISVVSIIRRSSVVVSFAVGAAVFREKNLRGKAFDLMLILIGMVLLYFGSK